MDAVAPAAFAMFSMLTSMAVDVPADDCWLDEPRLVVLCSLMNGWEEPDVEDEFCWWW